MSKNMLYLRFPIKFPDQIRCCELNFENQLYCLCLDQRRIERILLIWNYVQKSFNFIYWSEIFENERDQLPNFSHRPCRYPKNPNSESHDIGIPKTYIHDIPRPDSRNDLSTNSSRLDPDRSTQVEAPQQQQTIGERWKAEPAEGRAFLAQPSTTHRPNPLTALSMYPRFRFTPSKRITSPIQITRCYCWGDVTWVFEWFLDTDVTDVCRTRYGIRLKRVDFQWILQL